MEPEYFYDTYVPGKTRWHLYWAFGVGLVVAMLTCIWSARDAGVTNRELVFTMFGAAFLTWLGAGVAYWLACKHKAKEEVIKHHSATKFNPEKYHLPESWMAEDLGMFFVRRPRIQLTSFLRASSRSMNSNQYFYGFEVPRRPRGAVWHRADEQFLFDECGITLTDDELKELEAIAKKTRE